MQLLRSYLRRVTAVVLLRLLPAGEGSSLVGGFPCELGFTAAENSRRLRSSGRWGAASLRCLDDALWGQREVGADEGGEGLRFQLAGAEGLDQHADRLGNAGWR